MKKIALSILLAISIAGCGEGNIEATAVPKQQQQENVASKTAIYLPGGTGLDFGREPISSKENTIAEGRKARSIEFLFSESIESVSAAVDKVLLDQGYVKKTVEHKGFVQHDVYSKGKESVAFAYNYSVKEGFNKETKLVIWHKL